ncbi:MAG: DNA cytosine methyltransferase [Muribaculaceae bacterium]|nr:DNA cytosine methyltransferase [Muribaculaceae bacterium]
MTKNKFTLMDFVKRQSLANITGIFGEECLNEDGTIMTMADQAAVITHYLKLKNNPQFARPYILKGEQLLQLWKEFINEQPKNQKFGLVAEDSTAYMASLFSDVKSSPFPPQEPHQFTFIDLFAGIGGFRMSFQNLGGECVFSSEWDEQAQRTYFANYGEVPFGDITKESTKQMIPDNFDILCAGFPCQAFSLAGKRRGFSETRGTLFFDVAEILRRKQPKAFFLENVKGLAIHDKGKTLETILNTLNEVGYIVPKPQILNAMHYGVPQHRERIYIVGFRKDLGIKAEDFVYPERNQQTPCWLDVREENPVPAKYYLSTTYLETLRRHRARHEAAGHGFGYKIIDDNGVANAIVCGGMGRECNLVRDFRQTKLIPTTNIKGEINKEGVRKMTPREWARLQGYPDSFRIVVSDASAYKQFGNSVAVPAIQATANQILLVLKNKNII